MKSQQDYDVVIVGASLAGSACALTLSRLTEARILILDKEQFPRSKACGEGLGSKGTAILQELGVSFQDIVHQKLEGYTISGQGKRNTLHLPPGNIGVSRASLDSALLKELQKRPQVQIQTAALVKDFTSSPEGCRVERENNVAIQARFLVLAAGNNPRFERRLPAWKGPLPKRYAFNRHYSFASNLKPRSSTVHILLKKHHEIYLTPVAKGELNLAVLASKSSFADLIDKEAEQSMKAEVEAYLGTALLPKPEEKRPQATGPCGSRRRKSYLQNTLLVGDLCEQFDPIGGMGMTHALLSGKLAGEALARTFLEQDSFISQANVYQATREREARILRGFTRLTYRMLVSHADVFPSAILRNSFLAQHVSQAVHQSGKNRFAHPLRSLSHGLLHLAGL